VTTAPKDPNRSIRIPEALWVRVGEQARVDGVSRGEIVRRAITEYLGDDDL